MTTILFEYYNNNNKNKSLQEIDDSRASSYSSYGNNNYSYNNDRITKNDGTHPTRCYNVSTTRILVIGDHGVGKSTLISKMFKDTKMCSYNFQNSTSGTYRDHYTMTGGHEHMHEYYEDQFMDDNSNNNNNNNSSSNNNKINNNNNIHSGIYGDEGDSRPIHSEDIVNKKIDYNNLVTSINYHDFHEKDINNKCHFFNKKYLPTEKEFLDQTIFSQEKKPIRHTESTYNKMVFNCDLSMDIQIIEVSNEVFSNDFSSLRKLQIKQADIFILCFDALDINSLENLQNSMTLILDSIDPMEQSIDDCIYLFSMKNDIVFNRQFPNGNDINDFIHSFNLNKKNYYIVSSLFDSMDTPNNKLGFSTTTATTTATTPGEAQSPSSANGGATDYDFLSINTLNNIIKEKPVDEIFYQILKNLNDWKLQCIEQEEHRDPANANNVVKVVSPVQLRSDTVSPVNFQVRSHESLQSSTTTGSSTTERTTASPNNVISSFVISDDVKKSVFSSTNKSFGSNSYSTQSIKEEKIIAAPTAQRPAMLAPNTNVQRETIVTTTTEKSIQQFSPDRLSLTGDTDQQHRKQETRVVSRSIVAPSDNNVKQIKNKDNGCCCIM